MAGVVDLAGQRQAGAQESCSQVSCLLALTRQVSSLLLASVFPSEQWVLRFCDFVNVVITLTWKAAQKPINRRMDVMD